MHLLMIGPDTQLERDALGDMEVAALATACAVRFDALTICGPRTTVAEDFATPFVTRGVDVTWRQTDGLFADGDAFDAVLCYPGGLSTMHALSSALVQPSTDPGAGLRPIFLYSWEKFFAPLTLQVQTACERGFVTEPIASSIMSFETIERFLRLLDAALQRDVR
jgi:hypothetical protein